MQEELTPCVSIGEQGRCTSPLGPTTVGLIYVNPGGPVGKGPDPVASGEDIRQAFARMVSRPKTMNMRACPSQKISLSQPIFPSLL
jgi:catalase (peroxidase I)